MIYVYFFIKYVVRWSEKSVRFENLMRIGFQKAHILLDFVSQCEIWHAFNIGILWWLSHIFNTSVINNYFIKHQFEEFQSKSFVFDNQF